MFIGHPHSGNSREGCFVLAKTVTGHRLPLWPQRGDAQTLSAFLMAWSLLNLMNFGKKMFNPSFFNLISLKSVL